MTLTSAERRAWRRSGLGDMRVRLLTGATAVLLSACAVNQPPPATPPATAAVPEAMDASPATLLQFMQTQRAVAEAAAVEGRWLDAAWAWDIVLALAPQDVAAQRGRQAALAKVNAHLAERLPQARAARARGQVELASRLYLEILSLAPDHLEAADALRAMERDRSRRQATGNFARAPRPLDTPRPEGPDRALSRAPELEHASLLASQGELDAAIALLMPLTSRRPNDAARNALLGDLFFKRAEQQAASDRMAAIDSLRQSLRWQPGHAQARTRLQQLSADGATTGKPGAQRPAVSRPASPPASPR